MKILSKKKYIISFILTIFLVVGLGLLMSYLPALINETIAALTAFFVMGSFIACGVIIPLIFKDKKYKWFNRMVIATFTLFFVLYIAYFCGYEAFHPSISSAGFNIAQTFVGILWIMSLHFLSKNK